MSFSEFQIEVDNTRRSSTVLIPHGELDAYNSPRLAELLVRLLTDGCRQVVVDLRRVEFIDSSGLGALVGGLKRFRSHHGHLSLVCQRPSILKVFEITGLTSIFEIATSVDDAPA